MDDLSLVTDPLPSPSTTEVRLSADVDQAISLIDYEESEVPANLSPAFQTLSSPWPETSLQNDMASQILLPASDTDHAPDGKPSSSKAEGLINGTDIEKNVEGEDAPLLAQECSDTLRKCVHMLAEQMSQQVADKVRTLEHQLREKTMVVFSLNTQLGLAGVANRALRRNIDQLSAVEAENSSLRLQKEKLEAVNHTLTSEFMKLQTERRDLVKAFNAFTLKQESDSDL
jgi:hypothetical protein